MKHDGRFPHLIKKEKAQYEAECKETERILRNVHADRVKEVAKGRFILKKDVKDCISIFKQIRHLISR